MRPKLNVRVDLVVDGVLVDQRRVSNRIENAGIIAAWNRIWNGTGLPWNSSNVSARLKIGPTNATAATRMTVEKVGDDDMGREEFFSRLWAYGPVATTMAGRPDNMELLVGSTVIGTAGFPAFPTIPSGSELHVLWWIDISWFEQASHEYPFMRTFAIAIRDSSGGAPITDFWRDREDADRLSELMMEQVHGSSAFGHLGGHVEFNYYRPDPVLHPNLQTPVGRFGDGTQGAVNWVRIAPASDVATVTALGAAGVSTEGECPVYTRPAGLRPTANDHAYRQTIYRVRAGPSRSKLTTIGATIIQDWFYVPTLPTQPRRLVAQFFA